MVDGRADRKESATEKPAWKGIWIKKPRDCTHTHSQGVLSRCFNSYKSRLRKNLCAEEN
jgi:hypothetical protein